MRRAVFTSLLGALLAVGGGTPVLAYENSQHKNITTFVIGQMTASDYPDLVKFGPTIINWSYGVGGSANMSSISKQVFARFVDLGNPVEELAHLENQRALVDLTGGINGANFTPNFIFERNGVLTGHIPSAYQSVHFANTTPGSEGAYVWAGAAVHLIEDQSSPPHGANILHGMGDKFEGPMSYFGSKTVPINGFDPSVGAGLGVEEYYGQCLSQTQDRLSSFQSVVPPTVLTWLANNNPALVSQFPAKNAPLYDGTPPAQQSPPYPDTAVNGEYGGIIAPLNYSTATSSTLGFWENPVQADVYNDPTKSVFSL